MRRTSVPPLRLSCYVMFMLCDWRWCEEHRLPRCDFFVIHVCCENRSPRVVLGTVTSVPLVPPRRAGPRRRGAYTICRITNLERVPTARNRQGPTKCVHVWSPTQACMRERRRLRRGLSSVTARSACPNRCSRPRTLARRTCYIVQHVRALYRRAQLYTCSRGFPHPPRSVSRAH